MLLIERKRIFIFFFPLFLTIIFILNYNNKINLNTVSQNKNFSFSSNFYNNKKVICNGGENNNIEHIRKCITTKKK